MGYCMFVRACIYQCMYQVATTSLSTVHCQEKKTGRHMRSVPVLDGGLPSRTYSESIQRMYVSMCGTYNNTCTAYIYIVYTKFGSRIRIGVRIVSCSSRS